MCGLVEYILQTIHNRERNVYNDLFSNVEIWKTYTTDSLKSAILVYEFKKNIYDIVEFYQKTDVSFDLIIRDGKDVN